MNKKKKTPIKYTSRDLESIKRDLIEIAKRDYPNTYKSFMEASFGSMMFDMVAYVGDILSFYLDYSVNECFLDTAIEYNNVIRLGKEKGYRFTGNPSASGICTFFIIVPANAAGLGPNVDYLPILKKGSQFSSISGNGFILNENVDFSNTNNEVVVAEVDNSTGLPISYAVKSYGTVISGEMVEEIFSLGDFERFLKIELGGESISEIVSVTDSEGHEYYEVDYLSQDVIYVPIVNDSTDKEMAPNILKPVAVPRRFIVEQEKDTVYIQFGYGSQEEISTNPVIDPSSVVMKVYSKDYESDTSFDPTKMISTDKFGVAPSNTTLSVVYRKNSSDNVNSAVDSIVEVKDPIFEFRSSYLESGVMRRIIDSLECTNEEPIIGDITLPSSDEIRRRVYDSFTSQNRSVTREDYKSCVYSMPKRYGAIKRVNIVQDRDSFKRNLNMYVISENQDGSLTYSTDTIKKNLKNWIIGRKMINDTIDILDAKIINIGIEFEVVSEYEENKYTVLNNAIEKLAEYYSVHFDIGEPFSITNIYSLLNDVDGVADVVNVVIERKYGGNYSDIKFSIDEYMSVDGRYISCPENCIFEIKYSDTDITGIIK